MPRGLGTSAEPKGGFKTENAFESSSDRLEYFCTSPEIFHNPRDTTNPHTVRTRINPGIWHQGRIFEVELQ